MIKMQKIANTAFVHDVEIAQAVSAPDLIRHTIDQSLQAAVEFAKARDLTIDWTTVDMRLFRDISLDSTLVNTERDTWLTLRLTVLAEEERP